MAASYATHRSHIDSIGLLVYTVLPDCIALNLSASILMPFVNLFRVIFAFIN